MDFQTQRSNGSFTCTAGAYEPQRFALRSPHSSTSAYLLKREEVEGCGERSSELEMPWTPIRFASPSEPKGTELQYPWLRCAEGYWAQRSEAKHMGV